MRDRNGENTTLGNCMNGCLDGWMDGWMSGPGIVQIGSCNYHFGNAYYDEV